MESYLAPRPWLSTQAASFEQQIIEQIRDLDPPAILSEIERLVTWADQIHDHESVNLNPATNTMSPRAVKVLTSGIGGRPSLGHPGDKYEMGLEAIEQIETIAASLACRVFRAKYAEIRVPSGAIGNLYGFLATCSPGDTIIAPPPEIGGHVTHHQAGAAGLAGLQIVAAPVVAGEYTVDVSAVDRLAGEHHPALITIGGSLNLTPHSVGDLRGIADRHGAKLLFDAAHLSGLIAGGQWPNPLDEGAHLMTMSTYKSLAGPPAGLVVSNDAEIAERLDAIAFPGLTANFDAAKSAALAVTLTDWLVYGAAYAEAMVQAAQRLANELADRRVDVVTTPGGHTSSHAFALDARTRGGGHHTAQHLRRANILTSAIGLPSGLDDGVRVGTNEIVRWGATDNDMAELAELFANALQETNPEKVAPAVTAYRQRFTSLAYCQS